MFSWIEEVLLDICYFWNNIMYSITFRSVMSLLFSLFISLGIGGYVIKWLYNLECIQSIRSNGPASHILKQGTPTMGGIIMLISAIVSIMMWSDLSNLYVWYVIFILITYGLLGLIDDLFKIRRKNSSGLSILNKYFWQSLIALILVLFIFIFRHNNVFFLSKILDLKNIVIPQLDIWNILLAYFVIVSISNSVNLSDGLDGLAIVPIIFIISGLAVIAWISGNPYLSDYFHITYIYRSEELVIISAAIIGSSLGFLWFNAYPARVFMGDIGSLSFGGVIGVIAVLLHQEYLLLIIGGVFVVESLSVILQVVSFKIFKKRVFKMAPIHHHFELKGYPESRLVVQFWIVSLILVLIGLVMLKLK